MELSHEFELDRPLDDAWALLTDIERIAPCLPGAQLTEVEGEEYRGNVKVKVGPITAQYKGTARIVEKDDDAHRALLEATGRDTRGQGNATAAISAELSGHGDHTHVSLVTDLTITGKVAQFGRGVLADVSDKLLDQFVANLASLDAATPDAGDAPTNTETDAPSASGAAVRTIDGPEAAPVDLMATAGAPVGKRIAALVAGVGTLFVVLAMMRRRRRRRRG